MQTQALSSSSDVVAIARYAVQASAGGGAVAIAQDVEDFFYVNRDWLASIAPRGARLGMLGGRGDSMEPTISDGDVLIVTFDVTRQDLAAGGVFVFTYEGDIYLKRLSLALDGSVQVISDNQSYPMQTIPADVAEAKLEINARVIWAGGPLK
ncbi:S24 family peptidase [Oricola indica]|uniref:S24 family peptidase n=1 Tax=Oricola indica TaxID=2872591 RepID=UPI003CCBE736